MLRRCKPTLVHIYTIQAGCFIQNNEFIQKTSEPFLQLKNESGLCVSKLVVYSLLSPLRFISGSVPKLYMNIGLATDNTACIHTQVNQGFNNN